MKLSLVKNKAFGMHIYICINNLNQLIMKEEKKDNNIKHSLKLLNSFFVSVRRYANERIKAVIPGLHIEKITGNRMHLYFESDQNVSINKMSEELMVLAAYTLKTIDCLNNDIAKLNSLDDAIILLGADYGHFRAFDFYDEKNKIDEETSIGFAANYACKLQIIAGNKRIAISKDVFNSLPFGLGAYFEKCNDYSLLKYVPSDNGVYYETDIGALYLFSDEVREHLKFNGSDIKEIANKINFSEMSFSRVKNRFNINSLTEKESKVFSGIALFADIRDFTSKFEDDDSNLKEMSDKAIKAIDAMIKNVIRYEGNHIQIQGDREVAVFPLEYDPNNGDSLSNAVVCSLAIIDELRALKLDVGIGMSFGDIYAAVIDIRETKSNIILGETVSLGEKLEDKCASKNELVISKELYNQLKKYEESKYLCDYFEKRDYYYVTKYSLSNVRLFEEKKRLDEETNKKSYYGVHFIKN